MSLTDYNKFLLNGAKINFQKYEMYFAFDSKVFAEFKTSVYQITNSLILELYIPALTATNYLLERLLKVSLIYNDVKIDNFDLLTINSIYELPNKKYRGLTLEKTIERCRITGLINDSETEFLNSKIRPLVRNSYSHGDPTKIRDTLPTKTKAYVGSFDEPGKLDEIDFENNAIPTFQSQLFEDFAKQNAQFYFDFAYKLIFSIEKRIAYFQKNKK